MESYGRRCKKCSVGRGEVECGGVAKKKGWLAGGYFTVGGAVPLKRTVLRIGPIVPVT